MKRLTQVEITSLLAAASLWLRLDEADRHMPHDPAADRMGRALVSARRKLGTPNLRPTATGAEMHARTKAKEAAKAKKTRDVEVYRIKLRVRDANAKHAKTVIGLSDRLADAERKYLKRLADIEMEND